MKILIMMFLFICTINLLAAYSTDEAINYVLDSGKFNNHNGDVYFISNTILNEVSLPEESDAHHFIAQTAFIFLIVQKGWVDYTSTGYTDDIKKAQYIACPYIYLDQEYLGVVSMSTIRSEIDEDTYRNTDENELFGMIMDIVSNNCTNRILSWWFEE